jgi:hypothetical protein
MGITMKRLDLRILFGVLLVQPALASPQAYKCIDLYALEIAPNFTDAYIPFGTGGLLVGRAVTQPNFETHALLWSGPSGAPTDLHPTGFERSQALGSDLVQQVGNGHGPSTSGFEHALLWTGSASSAVDLHPSPLLGDDFSASRAIGVGGNVQVGYGNGSSTGGNHALLWNGTADSAIDLHPVGLNYLVGSQALATDGTQQVGHGIKADGHSRALLWNGTAESAVDLHPSAFNLTSDVSEALGVGGSQQVGRVGGPSTGANHAFLWHGTPQSAVDLHPTSLSDISHSWAVATNGINQVGHAFFNYAGTATHALVWSGTADSVIDLNSFLPESITGSFPLGDTHPNWALLSARAFSIDSAGIIYGIAHDRNATPHAVMWVRVPEPTSLMAMLVGGLFMALYRRPCIVQRPAPDKS